jgi:Carboxypeptidase regulatory-like domain/TonB dependent receptor-like, beta-barrel
MSNRPMFFAAAMDLALVIFLAIGALGQGTYQAQIRGVVSDQSGAVVGNATVIITENGTNLSTAAKTGSDGYYILRGLRPSTYSVKAEAPGFQTLEKQNVVLAVDQQTTLDFTLKPAGVSTQIQVEAAATLLDTESASLGTDVTNEYVKQIPLLDRNFFGLMFLSAGVTEVTGAGTADNYPTGTNFVSNGQRNATAEVRIDGALVSAPEQGEGATSNVYYEPSVEIVQEFKVQNNSYSAEFGSNGGTVVNMVLKSGTNNFHGSAWWFGQRGWLDANEFFTKQSGQPRPGHTRDQYGISLGGPIIRNKTFFFVDIERINTKAPQPINATVPTTLERSGDFRQTNILDDNGNVVTNRIFNPYQLSGGQRADFSTPNVIDPQFIDPIGQQIINLYPLPNVPGDPGTGTNNFRSVVTNATRSLQFDIKLDHQLAPQHRLSGRYSRSHATNNVPTVFGNDDTGDGVVFLTNVQNTALEWNWTIKPTVLLSSRFGVDRAFAPGHANNYPDPVQFGFPSVLDTANGIVRMPAFLMDEPWTSLFSQCCPDTDFAHTLYGYSSMLSWVKGRHSMKIGGEQRLFFNNFRQPPYPTGYFHFAQDITEQIPFNFAVTEGNAFADLLLGWGDYGGISVYPAVANKSKETSFYFQDDWKITPRLAVNLGLRYEWSTPYSERFDRAQFSDFNADSGIQVDGLPLVPGTLKGVTEFAGNSQRNLPVDRNNWAPRLGFAYQLTSNTVVRGGAGVYYGMSVATNFQYAGTAFRKDGQIYFSKDGAQTKYASLANPFPAGLPAPQGTRYGPLAMWGFANQNDLGTTKAQNAEIYQWNVGVQHLLPWQTTVSLDYSANRSTHLPWGGYSSTRNRNFIPSSVRRQFTTGDLDGVVSNPFQCLFTTVASPAPYCPASPIFNEPDSLYNDDTIALQNVLRPFPQFPGPFEGLPILGAQSFYNSMQFRFQKRTSHYFAFEGNYTFSKLTDDSSTGANAFVGNLNTGNPQELDNLKAEHSISANDTTHRLAAAIIFDVPVGRGRWIGNGMNRILDAAVGGWSIATSLSYQTGQPIAIGMSAPTITDGNQRPNVVCPNPGSGVGPHKSALTGASMFNLSCFADPGDQQPGNAPRYFSNLRTDGIQNIDVAFSKTFVPREGMKLEVRGEFFNAFNTPRFAYPDTLFGDSTFGVVSSTLGNPRHGQLGVRFEF